VAQKTIFKNKILKVCYMVSLRESFQRQICSTTIPSSNSL